MSYTANKKMDLNKFTFAQLEQHYGTKNKKSSIWSNTSFNGSYMSYDIQNNNSSNCKNYSPHVTNSYSSGSLGPCGWACP